MGLDMYLERASYVKNWEHMAPEERHQIVVRKNGQPRTDIRPERISSIIEEVAYWRKANAIHRWFVQNCQGGVDDCRRAHVRREQLQELVDLCKWVLNSVECVDADVNVGYQITAEGMQPLTEPGKAVAQPQIAKELLPTQSGFFFGGTDYDQFYLKDLQDTIEQLEPCLAIPDDGGDYYYRSSW